MFTVCHCSSFFFLDFFGKKTLSLSPSFTLSFTFSVCLCACTRTGACTCTQYSHASAVSLLHHAVSIAAARANTANHAHFLVSPYWCQLALSFYFFLFLWESQSDWRLFTSYSRYFFSDWVNQGTRNKMTQRSLNTNEIRLDLRC